MATSFILEYDGRPVAEVEADYDTPVFAGSCRFYDEEFGRRVAATSEFADWAFDLAEQRGDDQSDEEYDAAYLQERRRGITEDDVKAFTSGRWLMVDNQGDCYRPNLMHLEAGGYINWRPGDVIERRKN